MTPEEALRVIVLYAMNHSSCGKLPSNEYEAYLKLKKFLKSIRDVQLIEELEKLRNDEL